MGYFINLSRTGAVAPGFPVRVRLMHKAKHDGQWATRLVRHVGTARTEQELVILQAQAAAARDELQSAIRPPLFDLQAVSASRTSSLPVAHIVAEHAYGYLTILGGLYDHLALELPPVIKYLVISRILYPKSKLKTVSFMKEKLGFTRSLQTVYRAMDSLEKDKLRIIAALSDYNLTHYAQPMLLVYYDVTTLYFEIDREDEPATGLRKRGYSKDGKADKPQIVLGLAVNHYGMPMGYDLYEGNTFEGHTFIQGVTAVLKRCRVSTLTVVADAGMLSQDNLTELERLGLTYIVGARLKSLGQVLSQQVLDHDYQETPTKILTPGDKTTRLIVSYSAKRAKKAQFNREALLAKYRARIAENKTLKRYKYITYSGDGLKATGIDQDKVDADTKWDGLKGYWTNDPEMAADAVIQHYRQLWRVEQSFRMSKSDLRIRPTFHFKRSRIEAHSLICMLALEVSRMFELKLAPHNLTLNQGLAELAGMKQVTIVAGGIRITATNQPTEWQEVLVGMVT